MKSRGNKIKGDNPSWPRVENASTCQVKYCQEYEQCKYFVYNQKTGSCNLKKPDALFFKSPAQGYIFGPRYCTGNNGLPMICTKFTTTKLKDYNANKHCHRVTFSNIHTKSQVE